MIDNSDHCRDAASELGKTYATEDWLYDWPSGCVYDENTDDFWYNYDGNGAANPSGTPVCKTGYGSLLC